VIAPFYQRRPFVAAVLALCAGLAWLTHRLRLRRLEERHRAVDDERARIARDLHDSLGQTFTAIGYHLDAALTATSVAGKPRELLADARAAVDQGRAEARRLIWDLRQPQDQPTLVEQLRGVVTKSEALGVSLSLATRGGRPARSGQIEHEVPLLVQEAISNAVQHGRARHISVEVTQGADRLTVQVRDDGEGFDPSSRAGGAGLLGMRERARRLGGQVTVASTRGQGTEITLVVPHAAAEDAS
jgi:signal transduction histidine kinase